MRARPAGTSRQLRDRVLEGAGSLWAAARVRLSLRHAVVHASVDQLIVDDEVAALGSVANDRRVGAEAAAEIEGRLCAEKFRGLVFERLVLGIVAAQ